MLHPRALLTSVALAAGIVVASAAPGFAADASITHVEASDAGLAILVSVPANAEVDLAGVKVAIGGINAPAQATLAASSAGVRRTAVLAIDTSNSMRGDRFGSAKQAALEFIDAVPQDVYVGIVAFAGDVTEALPPTLDRAQAREVVGGLTLSLETRLYDGILAAVDMAGTEGQRSLLVLSDGADTSETPLESATTAITDGEILVDVVALDQAGPDIAALEQLATAGNGQVISADRQALAEAFSQEADVLARQILVTTSVPSEVTDAEATVKVTLPTSAGALSAQAFSIVQGGSVPDDAHGPPVANQDSGWSPPGWVMYAGVGAFGIGLIGVLVLLVPSGPAPIGIAERVSRYTSRQGGQGGQAPGGHAKADAEQALTQAKDAVAQVLKHNQGLDSRITARLEGAGSDLKSSEWLLLHVAIVIGAGLFGLLLGQGSLAIGILFLVLGAVGPWKYLGIRRSRRRKAFNSMLPETLQLMSGSLSAGLSLAQSVDTIVREGSEPMATEFKRVLVETRLGVTLEDAFEGVALRFDSKDFEWVVMAIKIQRQVGGNLAELLDTVAATMREREYMRRQVAALAAEGKLSAIVLGGLPPLFLLYLILTKRDYVMPMFTEPIGWVMLIGLGTLLSVGIFWMSRLIKVEV